MATRPLSIRVPEEIYEKYTEYAAEAGMPLSSFLNTWLSSMGDHAAWMASEIRKARENPAKTLAELVLLAEEMRELGAEATLERHGVMKSKVAPLTRTSRNSTTPAGSEAAAALLTPRLVTRGGIDPRTPTPSPRKSPKHP